MRYLLFVAVLLTACSSSSENSTTSDTGLTPLLDMGDGGSDPTSDMDATDGGSPDVAVDGGPDLLLNGALLAALRADATATMTALGYNRARDLMYEPTGVDDDNGRIECIYTARTVDTDGTRTPSANCAFADGAPTNCAFNTEHTVPRVTLRSALTDGTPEYDAAEGDMHHLFPSEELANQKRGNFDFGNTDCASAGNCEFDELSQLGIPVGGDGPTNCPAGVDAGLDLCVMQVREERRGDVARAHFYMSMRYNFRLGPKVELDLRAWSDADPPDAREILRNDKIENRQGNRNPFVDEPELLDRISDF